MKTKWRQSDEGCEDCERLSLLNELWRAIFMNEKFRWFSIIKRPEKEITRKNHQMDPQKDAQKNSLNCEIHSEIQKFKKFTSENRGSTGHY